VTGPKGGKAIVTLSRRLRWVGVAVIASAFSLAAIGLFGLSTWELPSELVTLLGIGAVLVVAGDVAPYVQSLKLGDVQIDFVKEAADEIARLENRLNGAVIDMKGGSTGPELLEVEALSPPGLSNPPSDPADPNLGRFGGKSSDRGFRLEADFGQGNFNRAVVRIKLSVVAEGVEVSAGETVQFFLHSTFDPSVMTAPFEGQRASISRLSTGGFTVGAWIPSRRISLELNLATLSYAPRIIREA
jgi:hypothetical protein